MQQVSNRYVFTTLRYDEQIKHCSREMTADDGVSSEVYLLDAHFERLRDAARAVFSEEGLAVLTAAGIESSKQLERIIRSAVAESESVNADRTNDSFRVRLQVDEQSILTQKVTRIPRLSTLSLFPSEFDSLTDEQSVSWEARLDRVWTPASTATRNKTNDRHDYDRARADAGISTFDMQVEVLLYNDIGNVMDASITTPYFRRDGRWITPQNDCGGQRGATRRWALRNELCQQGIVHKSTLREGEIIWLSNAVRGFFKAIYRC